MKRFILNKNECYEIDVDCQCQKQKKKEEREQNERARAQRNAKTPPNKRYR